MTGPKRFHKAFIELPAAWRTLSYLQRSIIQDLWRLSATDCSGDIETAGDPIQFLVRLLDLNHRNERSPAIRAVNHLFILGLLTSAPPKVKVHLTCTLGARDLHAGCTLGAFIPEAKPAKSFNTQKQNRIEQKRIERERSQTLKEEEKLSALFSSSESAREVPNSPEPRSEPTPELMHFRKPLPPEPPELKPPVAVDEKPSPELVVWKTYERALGKKPGELGVYGIDWSACQAIAGRVAAHVGVSDGVAFEKAAERLLRGWLDDKWVAKTRPGLRDLASRPAKYDLPATSTNGVAANTWASRITKRASWQTETQFEATKAIAAEMDEAAGWWAK